MKKTLNQQIIDSDILRYKKIIPNKIDIIRKMKLKKLNELIEKIDFENISILKMLNDKN